jgi:hypothetical protein
MKMQHRILLLAATAVTGLFLTQAQAENRTAGGDGIAASPKVRQMLNEHGWATPRSFTVATVSGGQGSCCKATTTSTKTCGGCCQQTTQQAESKPAK